MLQDHTYTYTCDLGPKKRVFPGSPTARASRTAWVWPVAFFALWAVWRAMPRQRWFMAVDYNPTENSGTLDLQSLEPSPQFRWDSSLANGIDRDFRMSHWNSGSLEDNHQEPIWRCNVPNPPIDPNRTFLKLWMKWSCEKMHDIWKIWKLVVW